jgi:hypothetical protein
MSDEKRSLFFKITAAPEERDAPKKELPPKGRLKYVFGVFRAEANSLFRANLPVILSLVPLGLLFFWYLPTQLAETASGYNFMTGIGIGFPEAASSYSDSQIAVYNVYQMFILLATPCVWLFGVALSGLNYICRRLLQGDKPAKLLPAFLAGIKKYWFNTLLTVVLSSTAALGIGSLIIYLLKNIAAGTAGAGVWFAAIVPSAVVLPLLILPLFMLPMSVFYRMGFMDTVKNAAILAVKFPLFTFLVAVISAAPLVLLFAVQGSTAVIVAIIYLAFGLTLTAVGWTGFGQFIFGAVIEPIYAMRAAPKKEKDVAEKHGEGAAKPKKKNVYVNPKQHKQRNKGAGANGTKKGTPKKK